MVADAVFLPVGVIGVARTKGVDEIAVITAALIFVPDQEGNGSARGVALEHSGEDFNAVGFLSLCDMTGGTRFTPVEIELNIFGRECEPRGTTIDDAADSRSMAFAE